MPINPYLLGLWLGDGYSNAPTVCGARKDLKEIYTYIEPFCKTIRYQENNKGKDCDNIFFDREKELKETNLMKDDIKKYSFVQKLRTLNLFQNKHIPEIYMYSSIEERLALLQGMMDSDGSIDKRNCTCSFSQSNYDFCLQF